MIVAFLLMSAILMMSIQTSMATEKDIMSNDVIKQAFDNNVNKISCIPETIETIEVYDSRLDEKEIIKNASACAKEIYKRGSQQRLLMIIIKHIEQVFQVHMERQDIQNHL